MTISYEQALDITEPPNYHCVVLRYIVSHGLLLLQLDKAGREGDNTLYLIFEEVLYFDGPMRWRGANFRLGTAGECLKLLRKIRVLDELPDSYLLSHYHLYKVETPDLEIKIIAGPVHKTIEIPPELS